MTESDVRQIVMEMVGRFDNTLANNVIAHIDGGRQEQAGHQGVNARTEDPPLGDVGGVFGTGGLSFPKRSYDPFVWSWDAATMTLTIGNVMLYNSSGVLLTHIPVDIVLAEGTTWINMTYVHDGEALDIGYNTTSLATASTSEADIEAGVQKIPLYAFTVTGTGCACVGDYIHHGAVGTTFR